MNKHKLYRYAGRNGMLTTSILLDGIQHIALYELIADENCLLTNGEITRQHVVIEVDELKQWKEIPKDNSN